MKSNINLLSLEATENNLAAILEYEKVLFVDTCRPNGETGVLVMTWVPTDGMPISEDARTMARKNFLAASENLSMYHRLRQLAAYDELTGLYNRRFGRVRLNEEIARSSRRGSPLCAAMLDLDHFKCVNDTYGHPVGDKVLRHVSAIFRTSLRTEDVLIRYGGEEILAVMPGTRLEEAHEIIDRLRIAVEENPLQEAGLPIPVTVSAGVALRQDQDGQPNDAGSLVALADRRLYMAKQKGRNRVVSENSE
ncbi:MAG: GGDEF domain-containing protein [Desulfatibacillum sp.]|nr:GGDEF domain-containing protein [Desulfatibacillum sp.]